MKSKNVLIRMMAVAFVVTASMAAAMPVAANPSKCVAENVAHTPWAQRM